MLSDDGLSIPTYRAGDVGEILRSVADGLAFLIGQSMPLRRTRSGWVLCSTSMVSPSRTETLLLHYACGEDLRRAIFRQCSSGCP